MADDICILRPQGRLDSESAPALAEDIGILIAGGADKLLLDMSALDYISSAGLRTVLQAAKQIKSKGGRLALCAMNQHIREIFEISGFAGMLDISPSHDEALSRLAAG
jgi:stage II sporulation protein AA (anti-sigma F factor antagonist)